MWRGIRHLSFPLCFSFRILRINAALTRRSEAEGAVERPGCNFSFYGGETMALILELEIDKATPLDGYSATVRFQSREGSVASGTISQKDIITAIKAALDMVLPFTPNLTNEELDENWSRADEHRVPIDEEWSNKYARPMPLHDSSK